MCRTGMCRFGIKNWIFLLVALQLFTYAQGGEDQLDPGVRFTTEPQDAVGAPGAPVVLPCAALTRHASRLAWRHSVGAMPTRDHTLSTDDKYRKQLPNGSLVIDSMTASLAGQYQCVVTVDGVGTIVSRIATVFLAEVPELVPGARSVLGVAGGVALLTCGMRASPRVALRVVTAPTPDRRVYGAARVHQAPPTLKLNVTWLKNGTPVRLQSARVSLTPSGALEMEPLEHHDVAVYRCRVSLHHSPHIYRDGEEIELKVNTEVANVEAPPRFLATPQPVTIMEGASVTFDCAATGNPKPTITWLNNGVAIDLSDLDSRFYLAGSGSLRVQSARALDAGAYTCRAHSRLDSADHTTLLNVQTAPRVTTEGASSIVARARGDAVLRCSVRGRPAPSALWIKDGETLAPNNHDIAIVDGYVVTTEGASSIVARARGDAVLRCSVRGRPAPSALWIKDGETLAPNNHDIAIVDGYVVTTEGASSIVARARGDAVLRCSVRGRPAPSALWIKDGETLAPNNHDIAIVDGYVVTTEGASSIVARARGDAVLRCSVRGRPAPSALWIKDGETLAPNNHDIAIVDGYVVTTEGASSIVARARGDAVLRCSVRGRPAPSALWIKDGETLAPNNHDIAIVDGYVVTTEGASSIVARARGDAVLRCSVRGRPAPSALWIKDGETLAPNNHDIAIVDGSSLRIQGVLRVDAGMFQCMATSPAGSAAATLRLTVAAAEDELTNITETSPQEIFNSLATRESTLDPTPEDSDFLGETSSAYTEPDYYETNFDGSFHAAQGLEGGNATLVSMPRELRAVIVKHRFVTLSWEVPERMNDEVTGYAVIYKVKGSERERVSKGGAQRHEMNIPSLQPNTTYQFQVMAISQHGVSPRTEVIEVQTAEEELSHGPPLNVHGEAQGPHAIRVSWAPPAPNIVGPPVSVPTTYTVHYTEVESGREQFQQVEVDPTLEVISHTISGLRAATLYSVSVAASRGGGASVVTARTASAPPAAPPANVTAAPASATSIIVRWEAPPTRTHGGPLTGYKVRYRALGPGGPSTATNRRKADSLTTPANTRRAELTDLDTASAYQIRVSAINANGTGPFSEWVTCTTLAHQRDEASVPPLPPPLTTRSGRDWISVWWSDDSGGDAGGVVVRGYLLGWGLGVPDEMSRTLPAHIHSHVIRGLESNAEYVISLRASNSRGLGPAVYGTVRTRAAAGEGGDEELPDDIEGGEEMDEEEEEAAPLIPPVGVKAIMLSGTTAVVYWTDPTLPKGQPIADGRRYVVRWGVAAPTGPTGPAAAAPAGKVRYFNATDLNCMLDELKPYTNYEFSVKLIKGGRESAWSMLVWNRTLESAPASPPRELRAAPAPPPARSLELIWHPPAKPNGLITGYLVMYAVQRGGSSGLTGSEEWTTTTVSGDRTRARVDRLRPRTTYHIKMQAKNSKGLGPACAPITYTTAMETGEGGGLASATSAWLWASAGGACAVLALAAALALSLCCRRNHPPLSPDTSAMVSSTYQKSSASAAIKPPDLWIHHDQMELKHMDKGLHHSASKISAGSVEGGLMSSTLTLGRAPAPCPAPAEYEPAPHPHPPPASLDRRHYVPTYVDYRAPSLGSGSDDTAIMRASPSLSPSPLAPLLPTSSCVRCDDYGYKPMTGMSMAPGCASTCERRHRLPPDQSTPLLAGVQSPQSSLASLPHLPLHPPPPPCGSGTCPLASACAGPVAPGGDIYACANRERGHYVAYEPLGHYTHRDSVSSEVGGAVSTCGSLQRVRGERHAGPLHSFTLDGSNHTTPTHNHSRGSARETSPYKKSASSSPGHMANRLQLGSCSGVAQCPEELEPLTPSRSTERLHREMQNLEGLMKDLSSITQHQFHC